MKEAMDAYILRFRNRKLFVVALAVLSIIPIFGQQFNSDHWINKRDTLLYCWHNIVDRGYPNLIPEDCYMELYIKDDILEKGFFWGTTDEFDTGREGYECGYFILPMTKIRHEKDSSDKFRRSVVVLVIQYVCEPFQRVDTHDFTVFDEEVEDCIVNRPAENSSCSDWHHYTLDIYRMSLHHLKCKPTDVFT